MKRFTFKTGAELSLDGRDGRIFRVTENNRIQLELFADGEIVSTTRDELLTKYSKGELKFLESEKSQISAITKETRTPSFHTFSQEKQESAIRKKKYLETILQFGEFVTTENHIAPIVDLVAKEIGDKHPPSRATVCRWYTRYAKGQGDYVALVDRDHLKGMHGARLHPKVREMLSETIDDIFLNTECCPIKEVKDVLEQKIQRHNSFGAINGFLKMPSQATIYRVIQSLDKFEVTVAREGAAIARMKFRTSGKGPIATRLLERVEIDHTTLDLFVIDQKTGLPLGRPTATFAICKASRMIIGYHIGFNGMSVEAVFLCLRHAILPKNYIKEKYPEIQNEWPCHGLIETLVCDNGLEFHAKELERVAFELGTSILYCPKKQAYYKGAIERFFKTLNHQFARKIPGHSFDRWFKRGDYDPLKHAVVDINQLQQCVHKWIVDIYSQEFHRGIQCTPFSKWTEYAKKMPPELLADVDAIDISLGRTESRRVFHYGIELNKILYNGPNLLALRRKYGETFSVDVRHFHENISYIYVIDPNTKEALFVPATNQDYCSGLTLAQHKLICERVKLDGHSTVKRTELLRAKEDFRGYVNELVIDKSLRKRKKSAVLEMKDEPNASETVGEILDVTDSNFVFPVSVDDLPPLPVTSRGSQAQMEGGI